VCTPSCLEFGRISLSVYEVQNRRVIEVGAYNVNGSLRPMVESWKPAEYIGVDLQPGPGVDVVCAAEDLVWQFGENRFDLVISTEMLEHVLDWSRVISNLKRVCKKGGIILITTRSKGFPYHGYPQDYWRFQSQDMNSIFADCSFEAIREDHCDPGVFIKVRKPDNFQEADLANYELYSIVLDQRVTLQEFLKQKAMKTLLFATMYLRDEASLQRYQKYLNFLDRNYWSMGIDHAVFIDDGSSPRLLSAIGLPVFMGEMPTELPAVSIFTFPDHKGWQGNYFQGWWRSFLFAPLLAEHYGLDRIIHIESDAYVLSKRLRNYLTGLTSGWTALWCPLHKMPETGIQVVCKDQFGSMKEIVPPNDIYPENYLPFTAVNKDFKGDRYAEYTDLIPAGADFLCQVTLGMLCSSIQVEHEVLIRCLRPVTDAAALNRIRDDLASVTEWGYFLQTAINHGVLPSLYRQVADICPEAVPAEFLADMQNLYRARARRNLRVTAELLKVLSHLESHGIVGVPFKGPVLAQVAFGDLTLRQFANLDVLVRRQDFGRVKDLLLGAGYRFFDNLTEKQRHSAIRHGKDVSFNRPGGVLLKIHRRFATGCYGSTLDLETAIRRAVPVNLAGKTVRCLAPVDLLLTICLNSTFKLWSKLGDINDVARVVQSQGRWDWPDILRRAQEAGLRRIVLLGLSLAAELLAAPVPLEVLDQAARDPAIAVLIETVVENLFPKNGVNLDFTPARLTLKARLRNLKD